MNLYCSRESGAPLCECSGNMNDSSTVTQMHVFIRLCRRRLEYNFRYSFFITKRERERGREEGRKKGKKAEGGKESRQGPAAGRAGRGASAPSFSLCLWETSSKSSKDKLTANYAEPWRGELGTAPFRGAFIKHHKLTSVFFRSDRSHDMSQENLASNKHTPITFWNEMRTRSPSLPRPCNPPKLRLPLGAVHSGFREKRISVSFSRTVTPHLNEHLKEMNVPRTKRFI